MLVNGESKVETELLERAEKVLQEQPKVDCATKNLLTIKMSKSKVFKMENKVHVIGDNGVEVREDLEDLDPLILRKMCASILKTINGHEMKEPMEWAQDHPQGDNQTGLDRIDELTQYKVIYMVWKQAKTNGQKVTHVLGRAGLKVIWPDVRETIATDASSFVNPKLINKMLDEFFTLEKSEQTTADDSSYEKLIWSIDFQQSLFDHSTRRTMEMQERNKAFVVSEQNESSSSSSSSP